MIDLQKLVRKNIFNLQPYSCARDEFKGEASVFLDANENPFNDPYNRYPDPLQKELKDQISKVKNIPSEKIFLGNGSDEPIDLLYRVFCEPRIDNVVAIEPTYGMYKVSAGINDIEYRKVLLDDNYQFSANKLLETTDENTKLLWLCSPNNPTGNLLDRLEIVKILHAFQGIVVVDEAYIDFSNSESFGMNLDNFKNLVVLQTFSKAWGHAAIRLGMAFASVEIIQLLNKIKYPYNINILTQKQALDAIKSQNKVLEWVNTLLKEREKLSKNLQNLPLVEKVYPSDANFILVKVKDTDKVYHKLTEEGIIVRNRNSVMLCQGCLRITVGTSAENVAIIEQLRKIGI